MKKAFVFLTLVASMVSAKAVTVSVVTGNGGPPIKLFTSTGQAGTALATGVVKVGYFSEAYTVTKDSKLSEVASKMVFLGTGGNAGGLNGTGPALSVGGVVSGQITNFKPASGGVSFQNKQMYVIFAAGSTSLDITTASDTVPWAMVTVAGNNLWNTQASDTGNKTLSMVTVAASGTVSHGILENDGTFGAPTVTTGIGLTPSVPEPASALFFGIAGLLGLVRRRR